MGNPDDADDAIRGVQYSSSTDRVVIDDDAVDTNEERTCSENIKRLPLPNVPIILFTETCERFSYYGIKTALILYLTGKVLEGGLGFDKAQGKAHYHAFGMLSYFTGVFGAMMADSKLGKFRTIFWSLFLYCGAEVIITLTSIPSIGNGSRIGPLVGLYLMGTAGGNIKPCVGAFGGDQIDQRDVSLVSKFFSLFYMSVNVGAMLVMIIVPIMRTSLQCFGGDCYTAVFGMNTIIIILGSAGFMLGGKYFLKKEPKGNIIVTIFKMIYHALRIRGRNKAEGINYQHWLDHAQDEFSTEQIFEVKELLKVLKLYLLLPVYWALFHQQGSSWTLQADQMSGDLGGDLQLRADHIQFFNPVLVLIIIPFFDILVYPAFTKCGVDLTPLKKMVAGMILTSIAFAVTGFMQLKIEGVGAHPPLPQLGETGIDFVNVSPCEYLLVDPGSFFEQKIKYGERTGYKYGQFGMSGATSGEKTFDISGMNCLSKEGDTKSKKFTVTLQANKLQSVYLDYNQKTESYSAVANVDYLPTADVTMAQSRVRLIYAPGPPGFSYPDQVDITYKHRIEVKRNLYATKNKYNNTYDLFLPDEYYIGIVDPTTKIVYTIEHPTKGSEAGYVNFGTFGAYTIVLTRPLQTETGTKLTAHVFVDIEPVTVHRLWQLPQYTIITAGEVLFSVTGLNFAYSQAPQSMKSVLQSLWLVTTAFGDFIVIILSIAKPVEGVVKEMFMYCGLMLIVAIIFSIQSYFYVYSDFSGNKPTLENDAAVVENAEEMKTIDSSSDT